MQVEIYQGDTRGTVKYDEKNKEIFVDFPDEEKRKEILKYLITERTFRIPESQKIDDYREDKARPVENITYLELSLSTLEVNTGIMVDWKTEKK